MWIFACGMQRAGSTLQFQIAAHLVEQANMGARLPWMPPTEIPDMLQTQPVPSDLRVIKTHIYQDRIAEEFKRNTAAGVYIFRDIRDVVVSIMRKEDKVFDPKWVRFRVDRNLEWYTQWTKLPHVLVSKYETVIDDLPTEVGRIAAHLNIPIDQARCEQVAAQYSMDKQRDRLKQARSDNKLEQAYENGPLMDRKSLLHTNHIQSGGTEEWRSALEPEQVKVIEDQAGEWLRANGYRLSGESV